MGDERTSAALLTAPFLPLRGLIAFPHQTYPIYIGRKLSMNAINAAESSKTPILLIAQRDPKVPKPSADDMYSIGTLGEIVQVIRLPDGTIKSLITGKKRARVKRFSFAEPHFTAEIDAIEEPVGRDASVETLMRKVVDAFAIYARSRAAITPTTIAALENIDDPGMLADLIVGQMLLALADQQALLETIDPAERLQKLFQQRLSAG